jgi:hypothetical protein
MQDLIQFLLQFRYRLSPDLQVSKAADDRGVLVSSSLGMSRLSKLNFQDFQEVREWFSKSENLSQLELRRPELSQVISANIQELETSGVIERVNYASFNLPQELFFLPEGSDRASRFVTVLGDSSTAIELAQQLRAHKTMQVRECRDFDKWAVSDEAEYLIVLVEDMTYEELARVVEVASEADVFLVLIEPIGPDELVVGPMLPPRTPGWFERLSYHAVDVVDRDLKIKRGRRLRHRKKTCQRVAEVIRKGLLAEGLPLLWSQVCVSPKGERFRLLGNQDSSGLSSKSRHFSIEAFLDPDILTSRALNLKMKKSVKAGELISISQAFRKSFAEAVWRDLEASSEWDPQEDHCPDFHYRIHRIWKKEKYPLSALTAELMLGSEPTRKWVEDLSDRVCNQGVSLSPSYYMPGDHLLPHPDCAIGRQVAFTWHLTKNWHATWGGHLCWLPSGSLISPAFNHLHIFKVTWSSLHSVTPVSSRATGKRLAINGWWTGSSAENYLDPLPKPKELSGDGRVLAHQSYGSSL